MENYETCWILGQYNDDLICLFCPHKEECSGADIGEEDE